MRLPPCSLVSTRADVQSASIITPSRRILPRFFWARIMLYLCFVQTLVVSSLILYIVLNDSIDLVYRLVFLVGKIFGLVICWDAVTHKNTIQAISFVIFTFLCLIYAALQLALSRGRGNATQVTLQFMPAVIIAEACCTVSYIVLTWEIYREYGWKIFRKLGADETIHKLYMHHQVLIILLQLEVFFSIAVAVQLATLLDTQTVVDRWLQIGLGIPTSIIILTLGFYALINENRPTMIFVILCHWATLGYFSFQLAKIFMPREDGTKPYHDIWRYLTFSLTIMLALNTITLINLMVCYGDFGKGLIEQIQLHRERSELKEAQRKLPQDNHIQSAIIQQQRWELD